MIALSVVHHRCFCRGDAYIHGNDRCRFTSWAQEEPNPHVYGKNIIYLSRARTSVSGDAGGENSLLFSPSIKEKENNCLMTNKVSIRFNEIEGQR